MDRFVRLFEGLDDGCCVIEILYDERGAPRDHRFLAVNAAFERHTGLVAATGKTARALVPALEPQWSEIFGEVARTGEAARFTRLAASMNRWFEVSAFRFGEPGVHEVLVHFKDVTARRALEVELRESQQRLVATLRAAAVATWSWDIRNDAVFADELLADLFSVSATDANGGPLSAFTASIHPDDQARVGELIRVAVATGGPFEAEYRLVAPNGRERLVVARGRTQMAEDGTPLKFPGVVLDVTRLRAAEAALHASEARLRVALDAGRMGTWEIDLNGNVLTCSDTCKGNHGVLPGAPFAYDDVVLAVVEEDRAEWQQRLAQATARGEDFEFEYRIRWRDGSTHWIQVRGSCSKDASGRVVMLSGVSQLIDERKRAEEALRAADRQKDEFLATASHELRTPLTAILGWARLLGTEQLDASAVRRAAQTIERNAKAQVRLIDDILDGARAVTGKLRLEVRPLEVTALVTAALDALRPAAAAKEIELTATIAPTATQIVGDRERLQQILWNLASNAIKFTPKGGAVDVRVARDGERIEVTVSDTGIGIPKAFLPFVFDRFRQADSSTTRRHGGLGLGLALVRHITEAHGGTVRAESLGEGAGATFVVTLPVRPRVGEGSSPEASGPPPAASAGAASVRAEPLSVLLVDDEGDTRDLLATLLRANGVEVTTAPSADRALELLAESTPTVLVSDIGMPDADGYTLIRRVRTQLGTRGLDLPAVALTAYARSDDKRRALDAGFQDYLAKPIEGDELLRVVRDLAAARAEAPRAPAREAPVRRATIFAKLEKTISVFGIPEALRFLNSRTPHRFTGIYRFDRPVLRNLYLVDAEDRAVIKGDDISFAAAYCARLGEATPVFTTENSHRDERLREHPSRDVMLSYCGVLLRDDAGSPFGTLCHFDAVPCDVPVLDIPLLEAAAPLLVRALG